MNCNEKRKCRDDRKDCARYLNGECLALRDTNFEDKPCPFYRREVLTRGFWMWKVIRLFDAGKREEAISYLKKGWVEK